MEPNKAVVHYNLALMFKSQGMLAEAVEHYRKALQIEPNDSDTHNNLGNALKLQGKIDAAIEHYRYLRERYSGHGNYYFGEGSRNTLG